MYEFREVRTIWSRVAGGISAAVSPASACRASAAMAIFSSAVNATKGSTAVTRESREGLGAASSQLSGCTGRRNTHAESLRDTRPQETHEIDVLFARELRGGGRSGVLMLKHEIVSDVRGTQPYHLGNINMPMSRLERAAAYGNGYERKCPRKSKWRLGYLPYSQGIKRDERIFSSWVFSISYYGCQRSLSSHQSKMNQDTHRARRHNACPHSLSRSP